MDFYPVTSAVIELRDVNLIFGSKMVLEKVSFTVQKGHCLVIVGPSGQGKTSVLKLIAGLVRPSAGQILIGGAEIHNLPPPEAKTTLLKMGMLFQKNALFDSMTALENILFPLREVSSMPISEHEDWAMSLLESVQLPHAKNLYPHEMSGGMQKRLGIARALALKPEMILYDDPTAGLDPITSRKIAQLLKELTLSQKITSVAVTNDMNRAFQIADQIGFVWNKKLEIIGDSEEAKRSNLEPFHSFLRGRSFA